MTLNSVSLLRELAQNIERVAQTLTVIAEEPDFAPTLENAAKQEEPSAADSGITSTKPAPITRESIREILITKDCSQVRGLLQELGVPKVSLIPEDKFPEVVAKAKFFKNKEATTQKQH